MFKYNVLYNEMLAIVLTGQMRSYQNPSIMTSYLNYLVDKTENSIIDLYIFTWNKIGHSCRHGNFNVHNHMLDCVSKDEIIEYYKQYEFINLKHVVVDDFNEFVSSINEEQRNMYYTPFKSNNNNVSTCVPAEYKYQQAARYVSKNVDFQKYSNIIMTRPDSRFVDYLPVSLNDTVEGCLYWNCKCIRCMDHVWYGKPHTVIKHLFNIFDNIITNNNSFSNNTFKSDNNELLHKACQDNDITCIVKQKPLVDLVFF